MKVNQEFIYFFPIQFDLRTQTFLLIRNNCLDVEYQDVRVLLSFLNGP